MVLNDASGGHASTSSGRRRKVLKNIAKPKKILEDFEREQKSNSNGQMLKVPKKRTKLDQEQAIEIKKPATINSPSSKLQGRTQSKSSQEKIHKSPVTPSSSCSLSLGAGSSGTVNVHGYQVKLSTAAILSAIVSKYGDIAANCLYKSPSFRASLLEVVCNVVQRLKDPVITASDIQSMISEISDAETAKIDVSWLQKYLEEIANEEKAAKRASDVRMSTSLTFGAAEKEFKLRQAELEAVQTTFNEAEKRFEVFKHVLGRIDASIVESVAKEKSWQRRLDELLCTK
ncbi:hypothetical protein Leryth_005177 [Lithospermum erythrorhizon]|nr:hypothetical protein Leryth_005177 [Lithospermum erythrorhizon]